MMFRLDGDWLIKTALEQGSLMDFRRIVGMSRQAFSAMLCRVRDGRLIQERTVGRLALALGLELSQVSGGFERQRRKTIAEGRKPGSGRRKAAKRN